MSYADTDYTVTTICNTTPTDVDQKILTLKEITFSGRLFSPDGTTQQLNDKELSNGKCLESDRQNTYCL